MTTQTKQQIARLEAILNGETVDGMKLNDAGLGYEWVIKTIATLRKQERQTRPVPAWVVYFKSADSDQQHRRGPMTESVARHCAAVLATEYREVEAVKTGAML